MKIIYIFDLEGTLSNHSHRLHLLPKVSEKEANSKDHYAAFHAAFPKDPVNNHIVNMINSFFEFNPAIILTGMMEKHRQMAVDYLDYHKVFCDSLVMRQNDDFRPSPEFKLAHIKDLYKKYQFDCAVVFDDREDIVDHLTKNSIVEVVEHHPLGIDTIQKTFTIKAFKVN